MLLPNIWDLLLFSKLLKIALFLSIPLKMSCSSATLFTSLFAITYDAVTAQVADRTPIAVAIA